MIKDKVPKRERCDVVCFVSGSGATDAVFIVSSKRNSWKRKSSCILCLITWIMLLTECLEMVW